jgi:hypothetical protein
VGEFKPQELANTAWAFATAGHAAPALFDAIAAEAAQRVGGLNAQSLANTAWSLAVADTLSLTVLVHVLGPKFDRRCDVLADSFSDDALRQLHQWWLWYAQERGQTAGLPSRDLLQRCRVAFTASEARASNLQLQVGRMLSSLGLNAQTEVRTEEGYSLDYVIEWSGQRIAIEVDGPSHFVGQKPKGATLLKRRQLRHFGWRLVSIPYWEWGELAEVAASKRSDKRAISERNEKRARTTARQRRAAYLEDAIARAV